MNELNFFFFLMFIHFSFFSAMGTEVTGNTYHCALPLSILLVNLLCWLFYLVLFIVALSALSKAIDDGSYHRIIDGLFQTSSYADEDLSLSSDEDDDKEKDNDINEPNSKRSRIVSNQFNEPSTSITSTTFTNVKDITSYDPAKHNPAALNCDNGPSFPSLTTISPTIPLQTMVSPMELPIVSTVVTTDSILSDTTTSLREVVTPITSTTLITADNTKENILVDNNINTTLNNHFTSEKNITTTYDATCDATSTSIKKSSIKKSIRFESVPTVQSTDGRSEYHNYFMNVIPQRDFVPKNGELWIQHYLFPDKLAADLNLQECVELTTNDIPKVVYHDGVLYDVRFIYCLLYFSIIC